MTKIGLTGTRSGMALRQRLTFHDMILSKYCDGGEFHHGDCIGADNQAHIFARHLGYRIIVHPPQNTRYRAYCTGDETREPLPYLKRNHAIVDATELLIACPGGADEELRSGTWATIRYARKVGRRILIVFPDGSVKEENRP